VVAAIYRARLPQEYVDVVLTKVGEATRTDVQAELSKLPPDNHLWGIAIGNAINGLIFLLTGVWTRTAGASFKKIVDTQGSDISHLMNALSSLHRMYSLIFTLIVIGLLAVVASVALFIYSELGR
jgi:hypothetical protein